MQKNEQNTTTPVSATTSATSAASASPDASTHQGLVPTPEALRAHYSFLRLEPQVQQEQLERFKGICALYGYEGFLRLQNAHVVVIGNGGVGSWIAESLCRTGVGTISLVDMDTIELSNSNRQLHTLSSTLGQGKAQTLGARLLDINPYLHVHTYKLALSKENLKEKLAAILGISKELLESAQETDLKALPTPEALAAAKIAQQEQALYGMSPAAGNHSSDRAATSAAAAAAAEIDPHLYVAEAIDDLFAKACCIDLLHRARIPVVTSGGAGGRIDPKHLYLTDVAHAHGDQLIKRLRTELRRNYGYPRGKDSKGQKATAATASGKKTKGILNTQDEAFKICCSCSDESPRTAAKYAKEHLSPEQLGITALKELPELPSFGASVTVTASAGLLLSSAIIRWIVGSSHL